MGQVGGLRSNQQNYQQCFIGHSQGAPWRETFEQVCEEALPNFDLKPWYADKHYQGSVPLRQKVVNMIATTRYGIYDLSYWRENDQHAWIMPRNVLIELGMAIALNRPMLLLRHGKNRECDLTLPACLEGVDIGEFGDGKKLLRETLKAYLPSLTQRTPKQDWLNRYCHFGDLECSYREAHPQAHQWGRQKIHIHVSDGANAAHIDCSEFRNMIEEDVIYRFNDLEFNYLDSLTCPQGCKFLLCSRCQEIRSSPFAIYRITPDTSADTFIAIGMSIALEKQFSYAITKILITDDKNNIPSLLEGYEIIVERNYTRIKDRLNLILPEMIEKTRQTTWKPQLLPFEVFLPAKEYTEPEETASTEAYSENDTQAQRDEGSSSQQETERDRDIDQMGHEQTRDRSGKFTERARKVLNFAQQEAQRFQHNYVGTEHLLLALVREGEGVAAKVLADLGVELNKVRSAVEYIIRRGDRIVLGEIGLTPRTKKVIELAVDEARRMNHDYIGTEHLLLGLLCEGEGIAAGVLESLGVTLKMARIQTIQVLNQASTPATIDIDQAQRDEGSSSQQETEEDEGNNEVTSPFRRLVRRILELDQSISDGQIELFPAKLKVIVNGRSIILTPIEAQVLQVLMGCSGQVVNRDQLLTEVWNDEENNSNIVDVYIRRLRRKLETDPDKPQHIISIRGVGYKFVGGATSNLQTVSYHNPVPVYISYAVKDKALCQRFEKHLKPLERDGLLEIEHGSKTKIHSMEDYDIMLHNSKFLLPLISPDYMISESSIVNHFIEEYMQDESDVIPIILRPTNWKDIPFAHLKSLPTNGVPVTQWPSRDDAFEDVALHIRRVIENLQNRP